MQSTLERAGVHERSFFETVQKRIVETTDALTYWIGDDYYGLEKFLRSYARNLFLYGRFVFYHNGISPGDLRTGRYDFGKLAEIESRVRQHVEREFQNRIYLEAVAHTALLRQRERKMKDTNGNE